MTDNKTFIKQVIVMRKDLNMRKGKMAAQASHASMAFITRNLGYCCRNPDAFTVTLSKVEKQWLDDSFVKICVSVDSEEELLAIRDAAEQARIVCHLVQDNGWTEFHGVPTYTCLAIGPDFSERIDPITSHLRLL